MKRVLSSLKLFCTLLVISTSYKFFKELYKIIHYFIYGGNKLKIFSFNFPKNWSEGIYYLLSVVVLILVGYLIYLAIEFRKVFFKFSNEEVFTKENSERLRKIGKGLIIYATIHVIFELVLGFSNVIQLPNETAYGSGYNVGKVLGIVIRERLPLFLVALFVQFISFIVVKGSIIKQENELTI
ncbi:hypothetical protein LPB136_12045 [Tenacibaculum todarodis]|uniref:DUF2975 domain-containing protein n=1 Tax=Tenacibaculum todarodis TaxID=1850252 RepID=A0A1L3JLT9_9FLAO|nr:DUF2975 domain-containing protein [Tenacibaculum todarodis]APG66054.1 hypothetical protein LPB136_12045 [Tenacibaculum todarodis]